MPPKRRFYVTVPVTFPCSAIPLRKVCNYMGICYMISHILTLFYYFVTNGLLFIL